MAKKRSINAKEFVGDVRSGVDDAGLLQKYGLTELQLQQVFDKLIQADFITVLELHERAKVSDTQITRAFLEAQKAIDELD